MISGYPLPTGNSEEPSFSFAQRDANLSEASRLVDMAEVYLPDLLSEFRKIELESMHADRKGWVLYKQAVLEGGSQNIKKAIDSLEKAVCMKAEAEYYLHLALALKHKLESEGEILRKNDAGKAEFRQILNRAFACCDHVEDLDLKKRYTRQAKDVRRRLRRIEKSQQKAIEANVSKPDTDPG